MHVIINKTNKALSGSVKFPCTYIILTNIIRNTINYSNLTEVGSFDLDYCYYFFLVTFYTFARAQMNASRKSKKYILARM